MVKQEINKNALAFVPFHPCLLGRAAVAGLALGGLLALGPLNRVTAWSDLLLHGALLILFWLGYVRWMI